MKKFMQEFKEFAIRGNVIDMAVGVVIGGAFSKIISSLVADLIMPLLSVLTGKVNLASLAWEVIPAATPEGTAVVVTYGVFLQALLDFILIAFSIFLAVKFITKLHKKEEKPAEEPAEPTPTKEELLLAEIRDLLKEKNVKE